MRAKLAAAPRNTQIAGQMHDVASGGAETGRITQDRLQIVIQVIDEDGFPNALNRVAERRFRMRSVFHKIGDHILSKIESNFQNEARRMDLYASDIRPQCFVGHRAGARQRCDCIHLFASLSDRASQSRAELGTNSTYARIPGTVERQAIGRILDDHFTAALRR
ncbi:MAG: hypothetical protein P3W94_009705 [Paracoccus sp. (in: a-proteobacteria)]|nr:hypothetical protein [Paracoccus sp. (in: a-proteobacteria)]